MVVEERIEAVQKQLDDALQRKAFAECGQMQETMDDLLSKRDEGGLSKVVEEAEVELAVAEEKRDFTGAAEAQARIKGAQKRLAEAQGTEKWKPKEFHKRWNPKSHMGARREHNWKVTQLGFIPNGRKL